MWACMMCTQHTRAWCTMVVECVYVGEHECVCVCVYTGMCMCVCNTSVHTCLCTQVCAHVCARVCMLAVGGQAEGGSAGSVSIPCSLCNPSLTPIPVQRALKQHHSSQELKKTGDTHRHVLMGWKWHFKGNVCPLKIRMVQGIQVPFFNGLGKKW